MSLDLGLAQLYKGECNLKFLILWREPEEHWRILPERDVTGFLQVLIDDKKVDPSTIMAIQESANIHWLFPSLHGGQSTVPIKRLENQNATELPDFGTSTGITEHLGWIAPDGRYFPCGYGGHREVARQIVGAMKPVDDARRYLEDNGWAVIFRNPLSGKRYMVGMGKDKHMNDRQAQTLLNLIPAEQIESVV